MKQPSIQRRPIVLLEVIIAFALVALCALPLIYPHVFVLRSEKEFVTSVELDHLVNLLYANRLEKLYLKEIPWEDIERGNELPLDDSLYRQLGYENELPYQGSYHFEQIRHKPPKSTDKTIYLFKLLFTFTQKSSFFQQATTKPTTYQYLVTIERRQR